MNDSPEKKRLEKTRPKKKKPAEKKREETRLSVSFHETFAPEREYIKRILEYAASGNSDTLEGIAQKTGIPMGKSSGKMNPHLKYAGSMGLITMERKAKVIKPSLTPLGVIVYKEDKSIGEPVTQWILHLNLCRKWYGAEIWYRIFAGASKVIEKSFSREDLENYLYNFRLKRKEALLGPQSACIPMTHISVWQNALKKRTKKSAYLKRQ